VGAQRLRRNIGGAGRLRRSAALRLREQHGRPQSPRTVTVYKLVPNTVTGLKVTRLNCTSAADNSVPLTEG